MIHLFLASITVGFYIWRKSNFSLSKQWVQMSTRYYFNALLLGKKFEFTFEMYGTGKLHVQHNWGLIRRAHNPALNNIEWYEKCVWHSRAFLSRSIFRYFSLTAIFMGEIMIYARLATHGRISELIPAPRRLFCHDRSIRWPDRLKSLPYCWYQPADMCTYWILDRTAVEI